MILIIAEKPSLGRNIAAGIGPMQKRDGYLEGHGYLISWAFGHLFSLCDIEAYTEKAVSPGEKVRWSMDALPCFPDQFRFELRKQPGGQVESGVRKQFETLKRLCLRDDVERIVSAGDADREGEIIIRLCVNKAMEGVPMKPFDRLWLPDQTPETVEAALKDLKPASDYDLLAAEGFARTYIDWLYGVNLTRYATLREGTLLRVGRVIVPIVQAIYERDMAIRHFVPGKYYAIQSKEETNGEVIELSSKKRFEDGQQAQAQELCDLYNNTGAVVTAVKKKKDKLSPGKLYSLSKLQNVLGKKYKMSMTESLEIIQKLYEEGYLTYPRTNSEYLATAEKDKVKKILEGCKKLGYPVAFRDDKSVFDDSKIESHSALTPTYKIPDSSRLSEKERQVYSTVFRRFIAVFCADPCLVSKTEITVAVGEHETFTLKGTVILQAGWTKYDDRSGKDKFLPELKKGDTVNILFTPAEKETSPPKHYTIETLNNYLKNPFKEDKAKAKELSQKEVETDSIDGDIEDDSEDYKAIFEGLELGTEATRTGIIDNARKSEYIQLKKDTYTILPGGEFLVESLSQMKIRMDKYKTSELGRALKKVYRGEITVDESVELAKAQISEMFGLSASDADNDTGFFGDTVGICPLCGGEVRRKRGFYGCENYKEQSCKFSVNTVICGKTISLTTIKQLLLQKETQTMEGFHSKKTGKLFSAALRLEEDGKITFSFEKNRIPRQGATMTRAVLGSCPRCGKPVVRGKTAFGCLGYKDGCDFRMELVGEDGQVRSDAAMASYLSRQKYSMANTNRKEGETVEFT